MSRLTDLIQATKAKDPALGAELEREFRALSSRRSFGLNFERHRPEAVELPQRQVRKGDKVRVLPPRGSAEKGDQRLWRVTRIEKVGGGRRAHLGLMEDDTETTTASVEDLVVVAEFRDPIYPGLVSTGKVERGGDKPFHTVINAENYHALKALTFTHKGKIDAIYIDPPYNTGAKDWKYNNDYVEGDDLYRHSKWLAFMERRLLLARELLNPDDSVLIITIDENELHRIGLLVEQCFPSALIQVVTIVINPSGTSRGGLSRVEEYALFCFIGEAAPSGLVVDLLDDRKAGDAKAGKASVRWEWLLRGGGNWYREQRPNLCYPVILSPSGDRIVGVGEPWRGTDESDRPSALGENPLAWPVRSDGRLGIWRVEARKLMELVGKGYAFVSEHSPDRGTWTLRYLLGGTIRAIEDGTIEVIGRGPRGQVLVSGTHEPVAVPKTVWKAKRHIAGGAGGTQLLASLLGDRNRFSYPKSLYAVEDAIATAVRGKPEALVLDFFGGSGTSAHAVARLNRQDGGRRQCILVTNNEVSAAEESGLRKAGQRPGDPEWERKGIAQHVTWPRIEAAITGRTPSGEPIKGDYKFTDEFPMAEGFEENAEFFTLTYESPVGVGHNRAFERIAPLLWLRAGARGPRIDQVPAAGWSVADAYGVLFDLDQAKPFCDALGAVAAGMAFVVTDDDRRFQSVVRGLPEGVEPVRLYESYLSNFRFASGE